MQSEPLSTDSPGSREPSYPAAEARRSKRRVALVSNLCPHYRKPLYELLAQRFELECFFFAESEEYQNPLMSSFELGRFTRVDLDRISVFGEPLLPGLARRLVRSRYDAVIMDLSGRLMVPYVYGVARVRSLPFVLWTGVWHHPTTVVHRATRRIAESLYRRSDAILVYGDHVRRALQTAGVANDRIFTAAQSVNGTVFEVDAEVSTSRELLYVGQLEPHKGIADLLSAFASVKDPDARLSLVGNGSLEPVVRRHASADPRVSLVGFVPQRALPDRYATARALVLPSVTTDKYRECWGLVVNEAMHAGLPVLATDAVGAAAHGLVQDGVTGRVVAEQNPHALGAAMTQLLADDQLVSELGRQARDRVSRYTYDGMADAFEAAVEHAIRGRFGVAPTSRPS